MLYKILEDEIYMDKLLEENKNLITKKAYENVKNVEQ